MKKYYVAVFVLVIAGLVGAIGGPPARLAIRTQYYKSWAEQFEAKWPCVDVIGIREEQGTLAVIIELSGSRVCQTEAGKDFSATIGDLIDSAKWLGFHADRDFACVRMSDWTEGLCMLPMGSIVPYPPEYNMWPKDDA